MFTKDALLGTGSAGLLGSSGGGQDMLFGFATAGTGLFDNNCCSMSRATRVKGFVACFCLGFLISCMSTLALWSIPMKITQFAIFYSIGNLIAIFSTMFLMGECAVLQRSPSLAR
jgi:hypothetical protein